MSRDPTSTADVRSQFRADADRRWARLRGALRQQDDQRPLAERFDAAARDTVLADSGAWTARHVTRGSTRGWSAASSRVSRSVTGDASASPSSAHRSAKQTCDELCAIVAETRRQVLDRADAAFREGEPPSRVSAAIADRVRKVGETRTRAMVNVSVVRAYGRASLDAYRAAGVTHVGTIAEHVRSRGLTHDATKAQKATSALLKSAKAAMSARGDLTKEKKAAKILEKSAKVVAVAKRKKSKKKSSDLELVEVLTAGDDDVCQECEDISQDGPYPIDEAEDLIPAHPNCRCAFVPADDKRFASVYEE